jgi:hypothetical protein
MDLKNMMPNETAGFREPALKEKLNIKSLTFCRYKGIMQ